MNGCRDTNRALLESGNTGLEKRKKTGGREETTVLDWKRPRGVAGRAAKKIIAG
jgi:hypothetical protein